MSENHTDTAPPVGEILEQLRAEVRARRLARGVAEQGPLERDVRRALDEIELHRVVSAHWPLTARSLPERLINMVNKVVRRALRWYINPIVAQQNAYNDAVARAMRLLADASLDLAEQVAAGRGGPDAGDGGITGQRPPTADDQGPATDTLRPTTAREAQVIVHERAAAEPPAQFPDLELRAVLTSLAGRQSVSAHWELPAGTPLERAASFTKRVVRQYLRWYINPIVEQQNAANGAMSDALGALVRMDAERRAQVAGLRAGRVARGDGWQ